MPPRARQAKSTQSRSSAQGTPDFNEMWRSKDLGQLTAIPHNLQGWCGCSICGTRKLVKGSVFRQHMWELHSTIPSGPSASKRPRRSPLPPASQPAHQSSTSSHQITSTTPSMTPDDHNEGPSNFLEAETGYDGDGEDADIGEGTDTEEQAIDPPPFDTEMQAPSGEIEDLAQLLSGSSLADMAIQGTTSRSPSPSLSDLQSAPVSVDPQATVYGRDLATTEADDLIPIWPYPLPQYLLNPTCSGSAPNPFATASQETQRHPLASQILPLLAHTLAGIANIPRRSIELVLHTGSLLVAHTRRVMYERFRQWYIDNHPTAAQELLDNLDDQFAPGLGDAQAAPRTASAALKRLNVEDSLIIHPMCRNHECNHVFLDHTEQKTFSQLPPLCPSCSEPLFSTKGLPDVLHYPRRSLQSELEVVFRVPGVEKAIERRKDRKSFRDEMDSSSGVGKIYRQQDDGQAWRNEAADDPALSISLNFSIDWANPSSTRSASTSSMGPFCLQVVDLPPELRSAFCCMMVMGITPAPKAPKARNLWKLLLPLALELRDAKASGIWIRTPAYPQGRLIRVHLACLCCDRPAACELTGGPNFKAKSSPCLRCLVGYDDLMRLATWPLRSSLEHSRAVIDQVTSVPQAVREDRERWQNEPPIDPITGERKKRTYVNERRDATIAAATKVRGNLSALALLPGFDIFGSAVFDPMHSILEGCNRTYFFKVMQLGKYARVDDGLDSGGGAGSTDGEGGSQTENEGSSRFAEAGRILREMRDGGVAVSRPPAVIEALERDLNAVASSTDCKLRMKPADIAFMQERIASTQTPSSVQRLHAKFGSAAAGNPTAHEWRMFATCYAPLLLPLMFAQRGPRPGRAGNPVFSSDELLAQMLLCEFTSLALRATISERQVQRLESTITLWQRLVYSLHPSLRDTTNIHVISHLTADIRSFGPTYGWWCFPSERLNYIVKNTNRSGGSHYQAQVVAMRAVVRSREVVSTRARTLHLPSTASADEAALAEDAATILDAFGNHAATTSTLDQVAYMYAEIDKRDLATISEHSTERVVVKRRGGLKDGSLDRGTLRQLQECLQHHSITTSTMASSGSTYLSSQVRYWEGIVINGRRLDAADWTNRSLQLSDRKTLEKLYSSRNSLFEARPEADRWAVKDRNSRSGVLCSIFEHNIAVGKEGEEGRGLFAIVRLLQPHKGPDIYGYRNHPSLDIWTWAHEALDPPIIIALRPEVLQALRLLAIVSLPTDPHSPGAGQMWATIPVHQR